MIVYDPRSGESVSRNPQERFYAASLNKLTVLATLYHDAARGKLDLDEKISIQPADVESYGTGVLHTYPLGYTMTLRETASYLIQHSDNTARAMFERRLGIDRIEKAQDELGEPDTLYLRNITTPRDVISGLKHIADPGYTSPELSGEMLSHMTDTEHETRLPAPLPDSARVAHKIGSWDGSYHDAGIVFYEDENGNTHRYFIAVLVEGSSRPAAREGIQEISLETYRAIAGGQDY